MKYYYKAVVCFEINDKKIEHSDLLGDSLLVEIIYSIINNWHLKGVNKSIKSIFYSDKNEYIEAGEHEKSIVHIDKKGRLSTA